MDSTHPAPMPLAVPLRSLQLVRPSRSIRGLALVLSAVLVVMLFAMALAPWVQSVGGSGRVIAFVPLERQQVIEAAVEGRVARWLVQEGEVVREGDLIVELVDNDPDLVRRLADEQRAVEARVSAVEGREQAIEKRLTALTQARAMNIGAADARVRAAEQSVISADQSVKNATEAARISQLQLERQQQLRSEGLNSQRQLDVAEAEVVKTRTDVDRASASAESARAELLARRAERLRVEADGDAALADGRANLKVAEAEEATSRAELARVSVRVSRQEAQLIRAPRSGTILRLLAGQGGEMVKVGEPLFILVPDTEARAVELWVSGNDAPLITPGRAVRLQFEGWPAVQFTGWPSVAVGTFGGLVSFVDAADDGKGKFRVVVTPDPGTEEWPPARFLRQGTRTHGWLLLDEVRLGWELWRQFNGFPPTVDLNAPTLPGPEAGKVKTK